MKRFTLIDIPITNPQKNIEIENSLIDLIEEGEMMLRFWSSESSVVMGRFQQEQYEVNRDYCLEYGIPILRRMSGGGTVYHDLGNLNITFVVKDVGFSKLENNVQGKKGVLFTALICDAIKELGIELTHDEKRNTLFYGEKKVLGSATSISAGVFLIHFSLLVSTNLDVLNSVLNKKPQYAKGRKPFVKSVRSSVINLQDIKSKLNIADLKKNIKKNLSDKFSLSVDREIVSLGKLNHIGR